MADSIGRLTAIALLMPAEEAFDAGKRGYTQPTNECLADGNASPLPGDDVAYAQDARLHKPENKTEPPLDQGISFRQAMADQCDEEDKLSYRRR